MYPSRQNELVAPLLFGNSYFNSKADSQTRSVRKNFNRMIVELAKLYKKGSISEEVFSELVKFAASTYVESEVTDRVDRVFYKRIFSNKHLLELF
jgi:hypothetical protein